MPDEAQPRWLQGLEGVPRTIAEINVSPLRVLAGPGTGKTFALMHRVARLLHEGATPSRILVCTFTRTAAHDLEEEVEKLGEGSVDRVVAGTLHAFSFRVLARADVLPLTGRVPRPLLAFEERFLLEDLMGEGFGGIRERERRLEAFTAAWARLQSDEPGWPTDAVDQRFQATLSSWLRFHEAMLVGEIVPETLRYLRENPASPNRRYFRHVLVDEYQDLNRAEQVLLDLLAEAGTLTVIGDEDQSIYSFKYAHPQGISEFHVVHDGTHDESLVDCRRCPQLVVRLANSLISHNEHRQPRTIHAMPGNPVGEVHVVQFRNMADEAAGLADFIRNRIQAGQVPPGAVLVLSPRRQFGYQIRAALRERQVHAHSFFNEEALDEQQAKETFSLLTLLANPNDRVALRCWSGFGSPSLRAAAWARLRAHCESSGDSPRRALERLEAGDIQLSHAQGLVERFRELRRRLQLMANVVGPALTNALFPTGQEWAEPFRAFASTLDDEPEYSAEKLRETLRIAITQPELPTDVDYVRIMSLHKSKGLTADLVLVVGCIEGLLPSIDSAQPFAEQQRSEEEQRRLFYVAITRTRQVLVLSSITRLPRDLAHRIGARVAGGGVTHANTITSRFLTELGPDRPDPTVGLG